jgi:hypothetical protein
MRVMQSAADANKVLVEIKTDGKPLLLPAGPRQLSPTVIAAIEAQYKQRPNWTV